MRLASSSLLPLASLGAAALLLLPPVTEAKVGKTKLSPDGLETSQIGLGALHFAELDGKDAHVCGGVDAWVVCVGWNHWGLAVGSRLCVVVVVLSLLPSSLGDD